MIRIDTFDGVQSRARTHLGHGRRIIGMVGKPGSGKSTLAKALVSSLGRTVELLPMDGYHLSNAVLGALGIADRKGAPHTFDVHGYVAMLQRLKEDQSKPIYYPVFDRAIEESIAAQGVVKPSTELVITEGNYLLLDHGGWEEVRALLDEIWFIDVDEQLRLERLIARHMKYGRSRTAAEAWARGTDEQNAILIGESRHRADVVVDFEALMLTESLARPRSLEGAVEIRQATANDLPVIARMARALWPHVGDEIEQDVERWLADAESGLGQVVVATNADHGLLGFLMASERSYAEGSANSPVPYVEAWYVKTEFRGIGVGRRLMLAVGEWARNRGFTELASDTQLGNDNGTRAHSALGFIEVERTINFLLDL